MKNDDNPNWPFIIRSMIGLGCMLYGLYKWIMWHNWKEALCIYLIVYGMSSIYSTKD